MFSLGKISNVFTWSIVLDAWGSLFLFFENIFDHFFRVTKNVSEKRINNEYDGHSEKASKVSK